jgi:hypothetical protein
MSRRRRYTVDFDVPPEKVYQDLISREYWEALIEVYQRFTPSEITSFTAADDGVDVEYVHHVRRSELPSIARRAIPTDVVVTRCQHLDPFDLSGNRAAGTYAAAIPHAPGRLSGDYALTETPAGSLLRFDSVCKVWVPMIGGSIEDMILNGITNLFDGEREFTVEWISKHH